LASATKLTVQGTYIPGQSYAPSASNVPLSNTGFFDLVTANRLQRLTINWYGDAELSDLDIELQFAGTQ
jgi:hypothetical protein